MLWLRLQQVRARASPPRLHRRLRPMSRQSMSSKRKYSLSRRPTWAILAVKKWASNSMK